MSTSTFQPSVLIIAGDYSGGLILAKRLQSFQCKTDLVSSETQALQLISESQKVPDLVLVSVTAEDSPLLQFPNLLKKSEKWGDGVVCVVYSAIGDRKFISKTLEMGFVDYIVRPIEHDVFKDRIDKLSRRTIQLSTVTFRKPMDEEAQLSLDIHLSQINEFGMVVQSSVGLPHGLTFLFRSATLDRVMEGPIQVRTIHCNPADNHKFEMTLAFVALDPSQVRQLRKFALTTTDSTTGELNRIQARAV